MILYHPNMHFNKKKSHKLVGCKDIATNII